ASLGSFETKGANAIGEYAWQRTALSATAGLTDTDRYLDPPVEQNYTNRGTISHFGIRFEHDATDADRFGAIVRHGQANFLVPNEQIQQEAGQRQDRRSEETVGQFSYQRIFSANVLADVRAMARTVSAGLWSNAAAIPIAAEQDRGFRELYVKGSVATHLRAHGLKVRAGVDASNIRERLGYEITDPSRFDPDVPLVFAFNDRQPDREHALFVQDQIGLGRVTVNAGVRWDHYRLVVDEAAVSPRLGVAWSWPAADLVLRASYDRAVQTPAVGNLVLGSSPAVGSLRDRAIRL